jgi:hypothetical protein
MQPDNVGPVPGNVFNSSFIINIGGTKFKIPLGLVP